MIKFYRDFEIVTDDNLNRKTLRPVVAPNHIEAKYLKDLLELTDIIKSEIDSLLKLLKNLEHKYALDSPWFNQVVSKIAKSTKRFLSKSFNNIAKLIAKSFVYALNKYNQFKSKQSMNTTPSTEDGVDDYVEQAVYQNINLIKSIPSKYFADIESFIINGINRGASYEELEEYIYNKYNVTRKRAKLIAYDQTGSINGQLSRIRQINSGYKLFRWVTKQDNRVRHSHVNIGSAQTKYGKGVYSWKELPLGAKGQPIIPSQEINCRCVAKPVGKATNESS